MMGIALRQKASSFEGDDVDPIAEVLGEASDEEQRCQLLWSTGGTTSVGVLRAKVSWLSEGNPPYKEGEERGLGVGVIETRLLRKEIIGERKRERKSRAVGWRKEVAGALRIDRRDGEDDER
ncbi:hypothetical protein ACH5RR_033861 [Cinchona calisaya]|uniref:Uncharacterized protein n=1 Tax=Cinchona calisaya TaxID=153742 RepID=A0ABD2YA46_9GENT